MVDNVITMPYYYNVGWQLTHVNDYSKIRAMYGIQSSRYVNWETSVDAYTTEQYDAFAASANGASSAE